MRGIPSKRLIGLLALLVAGAALAGCMGGNDDSADESIGGDGVADGGGPAPTSVSPTTTTPAANTSGGNTTAGNVTQPTAATSG